ncbi:peptidyl-prolyl cis-trans isomerase FKBP53-like isoform X1 [Ziziphus jujuba]|uniref:peptidylprolyl isomerase n=1 Tax=Ziziphus jujuba TaxID=326968 RepID=A0ABM3IST8_ZIZJJ|nr:peptidyl-prolyl cis-trans isomerase FKBP53-like isoform X1 [Ziziphus jujuba]
MAFWGIEVKPGKPFTHKFDDLRGRLHISMATLGFGNATNKSILQCNVGNRSPVYLCSLYPEKTESLQLNLEFEEADEVIFSVIGPRSIHLSGYYLGRGRNTCLNDDSESYGEDIADTDTQRSCDSDEDRYEDSFIDDGDPKLFPTSPISSGGGEISDDKKPKNGKGSHRRLRKKYQSVESDDEGCSQPKTVANGTSSVPIPESEDDDTFPISSLYKSKTTAKEGTQEAEEKVDKGTDESGHKKTEDTGKHDAESKGNIVIIVDGQPKRKSDVPVDLLIPSSEEGRENGGMPKKKRKERSAKGKSCETDETQQADGLAHDLIVEDKKEQEVVNDNSGAEMIHNFLQSSTNVNPKSEERPKKKRKELGEDEKPFEIDSAQNRKVGKDNKAQQDERKADIMSQNLPSRSEQNKKSANDFRSFDHESCGLADENLSKDNKVTKKKKKKKKKNKIQENMEAVHADIPLSLIEEKNTPCVEMESKSTDVETSRVKTFPNGLVIEELEMGKPDGKVAVSGKKLSVYYVGKLMNGEVVDSNVGGSPYKFRLGKGRVIEGWDAGLEDMRVGEKRRLTIPPSIGFGSYGDGKNIPPNSWLIYEIELVKVR